MTNNYINKLFFGAGILGALYLNGCAPAPQKNTNTGEAVQKNQVDTNKSTKSETPKNTKAVSTKNKNVSSNITTWNNAKLIGKDEGYINYRVGSSSDSYYGETYIYSEYLFKGPRGDEIALLGKEGTFFVGQNYNIEFYKITPNRKMSSETILKLLGYYTPPRVEFHSQGSDSELEGILTKYSRVKK